MDFFDFILAYYTDKLKSYEALNLEGLSQKELLAVLAEASALKKFMYDNKEEGYEDTYNEFCQRLDAVGRLEDFLARGLALTGGREEELFYLYPHRLRDTLSTQGSPTRILELNSFLTQLEALTWADLDQDLLRKYASPQWLEKTQAVIREMAAYTRWITQQAGPRSSYLCLLRDALIPYMGLRQGGFDAVPLLLSRKFLAPWGNVFYKYITPPIYDIIARAPGTSYSELRSQYRDLLLGETQKPIQDAIAAAREYLGVVTQQDKEYLAIESGVQGSMPLFAGAIAENIQGFLMYTTAPWLLSQYKGIIFRSNYNYLREMETLVCQNHLFDFHSYALGQVQVKEFLDPQIQTLAQYELLLFREEYASNFQPLTSKSLV